MYIYVWTYVCVESYHFVLRAVKSSPVCWFIGRRMFISYWEKKVRWKRHTYLCTSFLVLLFRFFRGDRNCHLCIEGLGLFLVFFFDGTKQFLSDIQYCSLLLVCEGGKGRREERKENGDIYDHLCCCTARFFFSKKKKYFFYFCYSFRTPVPMQGKWSEFNRVLVFSSPENRTSCGHRQWKAMRAREAT